MQFNPMIAGNVLIAEAISSAATQVIVTVSKPTDPVRNTIYVYGFIVSGTVAPGAAIAVLFKDGTTTKWTLELGTSSLVSGPVAYNFPANHPYVLTAGNDATLTVPSLGGAGIAVANILYQIGAV